MYHYADKYFGPGTVETVKIQLNHVESKAKSLPFYLFIYFIGFVVWNIFEVNLYGCMIMVHIVDHKYGINRAKWTLFL